MFYNWKHFSKVLYCLEAMYEFENQVFQNYQKTHLYLRK